MSWVRRASCFVKWRVFVVSNQSGAAFRAEKNLPFARAYEQLSLELGDNVSTSLGGLLHRCEGFRDLKVTEVNQAVVNNSKTFLFRYLEIERKRNS